MGPYRLQPREIWGDQVISEPEAYSLFHLFLRWGQAPLLISNSWVQVILLPQLPKESHVPFNELKLPQVCGCCCTDPL